MTTQAKPKPPTATNGKPAKRAAEKAVAELADKPREGVFRGITLTLPPQLPAAFAFDLAAVQAAGDATSLAHAYRLIVGQIGETQWLTIRDKIAADGDPMDNMGPLLEEILDAITSPYGMEPGEPSASAPS